MLCWNCATTPERNEAVCSCCGADLAGEQDTCAEAPGQVLASDDTEGLAGFEDGSLGAYRILSKLGQGAMGTIWLAQADSRSPQVAIKVLRAGGANEEALRRFEREANALAQLVHPNVVPVHDFFFEQGFFCIVMEYLKGGSFQQFLGGTGTLSARRAMSVGMQVGRGLAVAAAAGVVHRDIKPGNLLLGSHGEVRIADFGIAKLSSSRTQLTHQGEFIGTPCYMPPEQWSDCRSVDQRSDLYALGCSLFHLLCGRPPFPGRTPLELMEEHLLVPAPDLRVLRPEISGDLAGVVRRLMAKDPEQRFQTGDALADELARLRNNDSRRFRLAAGC